MTTNGATPAEHLFAALANEGLRTEVNQVRSRATLLQVAPEESSLRWTYIQSRVTRNATGALIDLRNAISQSNGDRPKIQAAARELGQIWESLARLEEKPASTFALLNAMVAYELAGYQANSACLARELIRSSGPREPDPFTLLVSTFFQRNMVYAAYLAAPLMAAPSLDGLTNQNLAHRASVALAASGIRSAAGSFLSGNERSFEASLRALELAREGFERLQDIDGHTFVALLLDTLPEMRRRSIWEQLLPAHPDNPMWTRYLRVQARGIGRGGRRSTGLIELWPSQLSALSAGLLSQDENTILRMPTSAGKTRVAEIAMMNSLITKANSKCVYIAPFRALAGEIEHNLSDLFSDVGFQLSTRLGSFETDAFERFTFANADVLVATPEKVDLLLRINPHFFDEVCLVVLDEGQIVEDSRRGPKYEILVTRLKRRWPDIRFLFLSAVVPRQTLEDFANWLGSSPERIMESEWRPAVQRVASFEWRGQTGVMRFVRDADTAGIDQFVPHIADVRVYEHINPKTLRVRRPRFPEASNKSHTAAEIAYRLSKSGSVLVFVAQRQWADSVGDALLRRFELMQLVGERPEPHFATTNTRSAAIAADLLGPEHPITVKLQSGIAIHHGGVPDVIKKAIERDFRERQYQVIVATSTLAQGVNLPIKTVVVHSTSRYDDENEEIVSLKAREYWNIAGRAGRARDETEGTIIHLASTQSDFLAFSNYVQARRNLEPLESALFRYLSEATSERITDTLSLEHLDPELLALLVEESVSEVDDEWIADILGSTLAQVQAQRGVTPALDLVEPLRRSFRSVLERVPEPAHRESFSRTGLSIASCQAFLSHVSEHEEELRDLLKNAGESDRRQITDLLIGGCVLADEVRPTTDLPIELADFIEEWVHGSDYESLRTLLPQGSDRSSLVSEYVENELGYRLPWGVSAYTRVAVDHLGLNEEELSNLARFLPSMLRYGVDTPEAVWCMTLGMPMRSVARQFATEFKRAQLGTDYASFLRWIASLDLMTVGEMFELEGAVLEDVLDAVRRSRPSTLIKEFTEGTSRFPLTTQMTIDDQYLDVVLRHSRRRRPLDLVRNYDTFEDRNAVAVEVEGDIVGRLARDAGQLIAADLDAGLRYQATILNIEFRRTENIAFLQMAPVAA